MKHPCDIQYRLASYGAVMARPWRVSLCGAVIYSQVGDPGMGQIKTATSVRVCTYQLAPIQLRDQN